METVNQLKGSSKRKALEKTAKELGKGGQSILAYEYNEFIYLFKYIYMYILSNPQSEIPIIVN